MTFSRDRSWREYAVCVLDCETTGLDPDAGARVVELAAVRFSPDGEIGGSVVSRVNPGIPIPAEATEIHGITDAMVAEAPPFAETWARVLDLFSESRGPAIACAYSAAFDRKFLRAEHARTGLPAPPYALRLAWLDPLVWIRETDRYVKGRGRHRLGVTCERWGIALEEGHRAEDDAIATGRLMLSGRMRSTVAGLVSGPRRCEGEALRDPSLASVLDVQRKIAEAQEARHADFRRGHESTRGQASTCRSCGASIVWIETAAGRPMPLNVAPDPVRGNVIVDEGGKRGAVASGDELERMRAEGVPLRISHHATCPNAAQHRTPRRGS